MSLFSSIVGIVKHVYKGITQQVPITSILLQVVSSIPTLIADLKAFPQKSRKARLDALLETFDLETGIDADPDIGITVLKNLPPEEEEKALDHLKEFIRIVGYGELGVYDQQE